MELKLVPNIHRLIHLCQVQVVKEAYRVEAVVREEARASLAYEDAIPFLNINKRYRSVHKIFN